jgi:predicted methyltransferase
VRPLWDGKANAGELRIAGPGGRIEAMSPRLYNPQSHQWSIAYGNPSGGTISAALVGGFKDGRGEFYGQETLANGRAVLVREIYTPIDANARRLEVAYSDDGGKTWETNWKMADTRMPAYITQAVGDAARPEQDRALDANRKPSETLAFAGVKPGMTVVDLMPGAGYFTRILSKIVGPQGKVYALQPAEMDKAAPERTRSLRSFAGSAGYENVSLLLQPIGKLDVPQNVDVIWTSMNYHDLHDPFMGSPDMKRLSATLLGALKPGGTLLVLDHAAADGSGFTRTDDLHRVDPAAVKAEVISAGFEFVGESAVLRNPEDDHTLPAFNPAVRGTTDRFIYKFRRPPR